MNTPTSSSYQHENGFHHASQIVCDDPTSNPKEGRQRCIIVSVYLLTLCLLYADSFLLAPNLTQVAEEFGFDEDQRDAKLGGQISLAYFLVGAPAAILVGWLADSIHRSPLFAIVTFIGEAACFSTYFVQSYPGLLATRTLTGVSVGGSLPIVYSVLGDLYKAEQRNAVAALASTATGVGVAIGQSLAGFLGPTFGWRLPFIIVSVPAFLCGFVLLFTPEPQRGRKERAVLYMQERNSQPINNHQPFTAPEVATIPSESIEKEQSSIDDTDGCTIIQVESGINEPQSSEAKIDEISNDHCSLNQSPNKSPCHNTCLGDRELSSNSRHALNQIMNEQPPQQESNDTRSIQKRSVVYEDEKATLKSTWELCKTPSIILTLLQGAPNVVPFAIASTYLNDYLAQDRGMSVEAATGVLIIFGAGNAVGVILGGVLGHVLYKKSPSFPPLVMGSTIILSCVPMWFMINSVSSTTRIAVTTIVGFSLGVLTIISVPIERAIIVNVTLPETRGRANAFLGVIDDIGKGFGPFFLSQLITTFGRRLAFNVSLIGWLIGGSISFFLYCTVKRDEDKIQDAIQARIQL